MIEDPPFEKLERLEQILWAELHVAVLFDGRRTISVAGEVGANGEPREPLTGAFLRWFLLEAIPGTQLPIPRVQVTNAVIPDDLDLEGTELKLLPKFTS